MLAVEQHPSVPQNEPDGARRLITRAIAQPDLRRHSNFDNSRNMEPTLAADAFAALAHETRLAVFRLLMREGPGGLPAGAVSERAGIAPSTLSFHLAQLERAGLLKSWRVHRQIFYAVDIAGTRRLITFLTEECCGGNPEICAGLVDRLRVDGATAPAEG